MRKPAALRRSVMICWQPSSAGVTERRAMRALVNSMVCDITLGDLVNRLRSLRRVKRCAFIRPRIAAGQAVPHVTRLQSPAATLASRPHGRGRYIARGPHGPAEALSSERHIIVI